MTVCGGKTVKVEQLISFRKGRDGLDGDEKILILMLKGPVLEEGLKGKRKCVEFKVKVPGMAGVIKKLNEVMEVLFMRQSMLKKGVALFLAAMMLVTAMPTVVGAESLMDAAVEIDPLEFYSEVFGEKMGHAPKTIYYAIVLKEAGSITLNCSSVKTSGGSEKCYWKLLDSNGNMIGEQEYLTNNYRHTITELQAGTYYLSIHGGEYVYSFTDFYYTFTPDNSPVISLSITLKKGTELQLGTLIENSTDKAKWSSTKKSVATVSDKGLVKAVKAGTTYIKATLPTGECASIKVTVKNK